MPGTQRFCRPTDSLVTIFCHKTRNESNISASLTTVPANIHADGKPGKVTIIALLNKGLQKYLQSKVFRGDFANVIAVNINVDIHE